MVSIAIWWVARSRKIFRNVPRVLLRNFMSTMACPRSGLLDRRMLRAKSSRNWPVFIGGPKPWPLVTVLPAGGVTALQEEKEEMVVVVVEELRVRAARSQMGHPAAAERTPSLRPSWPPDSRSSSMSPWLTLVLKHM